MGRLRRTNDYLAIQRDLSSTVCPVMVGALAVSDWGFCTSEIYPAKRADHVNRMRIPNSIDSAPPLG